MIGHPPVQRPADKPNTCAPTKSDVFSLHNVGNPAPRSKAPGETETGSTHTGAKSDEADSQFQSTRPHPARRRQTLGGARRDRTDDLMLAKHALSQLSYGPILGKRKERRISGGARHACGAARRQTRRKVQDCEVQRLEVQDCKFRKPPKATADPDRRRRKGQPAAARRALPFTKMVGLGRLELPTSRLSSARSNQLSYKPELSLKKPRAPGKAQAQQDTLAKREARPNGRRGNEGGDVPHNGFRLRTLVLKQVNRRSKDQTEDPSLERR